MKVDEKDEKGNDGLEAWHNHVFIPVPDAPCMEYVPTLTQKMAQT